MQYEVKKHTYQAVVTTNQSTVTVTPIPAEQSLMEPFNKALEVENYQLKFELAVLKEREGHKTELLRVSQCRIKSLEEENQRIKEENISIKQREMTLQIENQFIKDREIKMLQEEIQRLRNDLITHEQRGQKRRHEDNQRLERITTTILTNTEDSKRKRTDEV